MKQTLPIWMEQAICEVDPYLQIAYANNFSDYEPWHIHDPQEPLIAVTFESRRVDIFKESFEVPDFGVWNSPIFDTQTCYVTGHIAKSDLEKLHSLKNILRVELGLPFAVQRPIIRDRALVVPEVSQQPIKKSNQKVLIGVIDHGCPFAHRNLLNEDGNTRILSIWDQDLHPDFSTGSAPDQQTYGRYVDQAQLNEWIKASKNFSNQVVESHCYELAQYSAMRHDHTHGSHVVNLAGGKNSISACDTYFPKGLGKVSVDDMASASDLVFVQLPRQVAQAPSRGSLTMHLLSGISYLLSSASEQTKHVIAVIDYGSHLGSHDGASLMDRAMNALVIQASRKGIRLDILFPSGNGKKDKFHASVKTPHAAQQAELFWKIPANNEVPCFAEIWLRNDSNQPTLQLDSPEKKYQLSLTLDSSKLYDQDHCAVADVVVSRQHAGSSVILLRVAPTRSDSPLRISAPDGRWRVRLMTGSTRTSHFYTTKGTKNLAMLKRSEQSKFTKPENASININTMIWIDDLQTTIGAGLASRVTMLGACNAWNGDVASYSGGGPVRGGIQTDMGVDYLLVGEEAQTLGGVRSYGTRSGISFRLRGTSTAPPLAARHLALHGNFVPATTFNNAVSATRVAILKKHGNGWLL
jgi:hypothetical protein